MNTELALHSRACWLKEASLPISFPPVPHPIDHDLVCVIINFIEDPRIASMELLPKGHRFLINWVTQGRRDR